MEYLNSIFSTFEACSILSIWPIQCVHYLSMFEYEVCNGTKEGKDLFTCRQDLDARLERLGSSEISIELVGIEGYEPTHVPFWSGKVVVFCAHVSFQSSKSSPFLPWSATLYLSLALIALKPRTQQSRMDGTGGCGNLGYRVVKAARA